MFLPFEAHQWTQDFLSAVGTVSTSLKCTLKCHLLNQRVNHSVVMSSAKQKKKKKGISVRQNSPARVPRQRASTHTLTHTHIHLAVLTVVKLILPEKCHRCSPALYPHGPEPESSTWLHNSHYQAFSGICCMYCTHFTFPVWDTGTSFKSSSRSL